MTAAEPLRVQLQDRDFRLLRSLFESRVMTLSHIAAVSFGGKREMAKKRLQKLKAAGILRERPRRVSDPSVLVITRKAFNMLREKGHLNDYPKIGPADMESRVDVSNLTLRHELEVMDVKATIATAFRHAKTFSIAEFSTWPSLYQFKACKPGGERVTVKPDGFIRLHEAEPDGSVSEHAFFLEVDRSTEALDVLAKRCHCYLDYYRIGGFAVRNGASQAEYKEYPFRVLIVCKSAARRDNIARRLLDNTPPIGTLVWLATRNDVATDPLGDIWIRPADLRSSAGATQGEPRATPWASQPALHVGIKHRLLEYR